MAGYKPEKDAADDLSPKIHLTIHLIGIRGGKL
jgi:hypothetical protein